jgi:hypothetical protein
MAILADLRPAAQRLAMTRRRRGARTAGLTAATVGLMATAAPGANAILGRPAPESVKRDLRAVDHGMPAGLRAIPTSSARTRSPSRAARSSTSPNWPTAAIAPSS